jgi:hypothetical protein
LAEVRGRSSGERHNHAVSLSKLPEARSDGQEGSASDLGQCSWHKSKFVCRWIAAHNRKVKNGGLGVWIVPCLLPKKSPWLTPIEPKWMHGKRKVTEPDGLLTAHGLADRVCKVFGCAHEEHLSISQEAA